MSATRFDWEYNMLEREKAFRSNIFEAMVEYIEAMEKSGIKTTAGIKKRIKHYLAELKSL